MDLMHHNCVGVVRCSWVVAVPISLGLLAHAFFCFLGLYFHSFSIDVFQKQG